MLKKEQSKGAFSPRFVTREKRKKQPKKRMTFPKQAMSNPRGAQRAIKGQANGARSKGKYLLVHEF
jgi:hypothetical protein